MDAGVEGAVLYTKRFPLMGGGLIEFVDDRGEERARKIASAVEEEARRIEAKFSRYRESSVVSEINRNAGRTPVAVDEETDMLVASALDLASLTGGRFDPTVGVLRRAWDFRAAASRRADELSALLPLVDTARSPGETGPSSFAAPEWSSTSAASARSTRWTAPRSSSARRGPGGDRQLRRRRADRRRTGRRPALDGRRRRPARPRPLPLRRRGSRARASPPPATTSAASSRTASATTTSWTPRRMARSRRRLGHGRRGLRLPAGRFATAAFLLGAEEGLALLEETPEVEGALITEDGAILPTAGMRFLSDLPGSAWSANVYF